MERINEVCRKIMTDLENSLAQFAGKTLDAEGMIDFEKYIAETLTYYFKGTYKEFVFPINSITFDKNVYRLNLRNIANANPWLSEKEVCCAFFDISEDIVEEARIDDDGYSIHLKLNNPINFFAVSVMLPT